MAEPDSEAAPGDEPHPTQDRMESVVTWVALVWVSGVAIVDEVYGGAFGLIGFLAIGPFIAAAFATPRRTALVGLYATVFSLVLSTPPRQYGQLNHLLRVLSLVASSGVAVWISSLRTQRRPATLVRPQSHAQRAAAAGGGRDGPTHAGHGPGLDDGGRPGSGGGRRLRRPARRTAGWTPPSSPPPTIAGCSARTGSSATTPCGTATTCWSRSTRTGPSATSCRRRVALIAESVSDLAREWPIIEASMRTTRFSSLAVVPLVVSDRAVGVVVVHGLQPRTISKADRSFLFTITGAAAQAVERARLTVTEFANLERAQHLQHLTSALAAATTPGDVAGAALGAGLRALGAHSAVCRVPLDRGPPVPHVRGQQRASRGASPPRRGRARDRLGRGVPVGSHRDRDRRRTPAPRSRRVERGGPRRPRRSSTSPSPSWRNRSPGTSGRSACSCSPSWPNTSRATPSFVSCPRWPA